MGTIFNHEKFREVRQAAGMSLHEVVFALAREGVQITSEAVRNWEAGAVPGLLVVLKWHAIMGTPMAKEARALLAYHFQEEEAKL